MKRLVLGFLSIFSLLFTLNACCQTGVISPPAIPGPELAKQLTSDTVALVTNFGDMDTTHGAFCTGVWVGERTILTANHCIEGYAKMYHRSLVVEAWLKHGVPRIVIGMLLEAELDDASDIVQGSDPDEEKMSDAVKEVIAIAKSISPVNPDEVFVPYIIQSAVTDKGVALSSLHLTQVVARSKSDDLAIIQVSGKHPKHLVAKVAQTSPLVGEQIELMGHIHHNFWFYRQGLVGAYRSSVDDLPEIHGPFLEIAGNVGHGDSGGGAYNSQGELIGIASFISGDEVQSGYYIHLDTIRGFLAAQHVLTLKIDTTAKDPDLGDATLNKE